MSELVINLLPVASGGGLQNAMSFLVESDLEGVSVYCRAGLGLEELARSKGASARSFAGITGRLLGEIEMVGACRSGDKIFTLFGPPPLVAKRGVVNVVGCAYSNLFYPEIDFWAGETLLRKMGRLGIDLYRKWSLARADYWIFETEALRRRACDIFGFDNSRCAVIRMAPGHWASEMLRCTPPMLSGDQFRVLYLTGYHPNKRIEALVRVCEVLQRRGNDAVRFVLTLDESTPQVRSLSERLGSLSRYFDFVGRVNPADVPSLIGSCGAMCNLAVLESFSNNVVEAWAGRKPLIITDAEWSRDACGHAALYVDPSDAEVLADAIELLQYEPEKRSVLVQAGLDMLNQYPTSKQRVRDYWRFIAGCNSAARRHRAEIWRRS